MRLTFPPLIVACFLFASLFASATDVVGKNEGDTVVLTSVSKPLSLRNLQTPEGCNWQCSPNSDGTQTCGCCYRHDEITTICTADTTCLDDGSRYCYCGISTNGFPCKYCEICPNGLDTRNDCSNVVPTLQAVECAATVPSPPLPAPIPTPQQTNAPTPLMTKAPTFQQSMAPLPQMTNAPTNQQTSAPFAQMTKAPTTQQTMAPFAQMTQAPTMQQTTLPQVTKSPTSQQTMEPTPQAPTPQEVTLPGSQFPQASTPPPVRLTVLPRQSPPPIVAPSVDAPSTSAPANWT